MERRLRSGTPPLLLRQGKREREEERERERKRKKEDEKEERKEGLARGRGKAGQRNAKRRKDIGVLYIEKRCCAVDRATVDLVS